MKRKAVLKQIVTKLLSAVMVLTFIAAAPAIVFAQWTGQHDANPIVIGTVRSYNSNTATNIALMDGSTVVASTTIAPVDLGGGVFTQRFVLTDVPRGTYTLVVTKPWHLSYTINNLPVFDDIVDVNALIEGVIHLPGGDINERGSINTNDFVYFSQYIGACAVTYPKADVNGDGVIDRTDRDIMALYLTQSGPVITLPPPNGVVVTGVVRSFNPRNPTNIVLLDGTNEVASTTIEPFPFGRGMFTQTFVVPDVPPGTYTVVISKQNNLNFTINNLVVSNTDVDLSPLLLATNKKLAPVLPPRPPIIPAAHPIYMRRGVIELTPGDVNGDGATNIRDTVYITQYRDQLASVAPHADVNDDGVIDQCDIDIVLGIISGTYPFWGNGSPTVITLP
jgi:hypothetical protein